MGSSAMWPSWLDPAAMGDPEVSSVRLRVLAGDLRESAVTIASAVGGIAPGAPGLCWEGSAAKAFEGWVGDFDARVWQAVTVAAAAASAKRECADEVERCEAAVVGLRERLRVVVSRGGGASAAVPDDLAGEVAAVWDTHGRVLRDAWAAEGRADRALTSALREVPGRPRSVMDHLVGGAAGFVRGAVLSPMADVWGVTAQGLYDAEGWRANVDAAVSGWGTAIGHLWAHPVSGGAAVVKEEVGWQEWADGGYGAGVGAVAVAIAPMGRVGRAVDPLPVSPRRSYSGPGGSQSFQDMLDLVDLAAHEDVGHTLSRHVDVTDEDLVARVTGLPSVTERSVRRARRQGSPTGTPPSWPSHRRCRRTRPQSCGRSLKASSRMGRGNPST